MTQRPTYDARHASQVPRRRRAAPLAPTALDRMLQRAQLAAPALTQATDVVLIIAAGLLTFVDVAVWATDPVVDNGRLPVSLALLVPALGALATLAVALRPRRLTLSVLLLAGASTALTFGSWTIGASLPPSFAALFALGVLTIGVLRREPGHAALPLAALAAISVAAEAVRPMVGTAGYLLVVCGGAFVVAVGVGIYLRWSDWRRVVAADAARTEERLEIARELHDLVGHYLTGIVVQAQSARHVARNQPTAAAAALERIERAGAEALAGTRQLVRGLRDETPVPPGGSWDEIDQLVADAVAQGDPVIAGIDPGVRDLPASLVPSVHRIIAESLTNVRRHARDLTCIEVTMGVDDNELVVTVQNDGSAAGSYGHDNFGIVGMRERASYLGGSLRAGPAPGGGWAVQAKLPVEVLR